MIKPVQRRLLHVAAAMLLSTAYRQTGAQVESTMKKLPGGEAAAIEKRLSLKLLPARADQVEFEREQAVTLAGPAALVLMPVRFRVAGPSSGASPHFACGLYVKGGGGRTRFVATFGSDWTAAESCIGLTAVGAVASRTAPEGAGATYPDVILIYQAGTAADSFPDPVLLTWDERESSFRADAEESRWLREQKDGHTVPGARRLLAMHTRGRPSTESRDASASHTN